MKNCLARSVLAAVALLALAGPAGAQTPPQSKLFPLTPCRVADTRITPNGANAGPVLQANAGRAFPIVGTCAIPPTARSVVLNVTAVNATVNGSFAIFPTGTASPLGATAVSYRAVKARAASFIARLGTTGDIVVLPIQPSGTVHLILDVTGYFEDPSALTLAHVLTTFANIATLRRDRRSSSPTSGTSASTGWLNEQFAIPPNYYALLALQPDTIPGACTGTCQRDNYTMYPLQRTLLLQRALLPGPAPAARRLGAPQVHRRSRASRRSSRAT